MAITLYNERTGTAVGTLTAAQLSFLQANLEEEGERDTDYYVDQAVIDLLEARGADAPLLALLRAAIGTQGEADLRWVEE